jgi:dolichol-phosphate mannosyltransferase
LVQPILDFSQREIVYDAKLAVIIPAYNEKDNIGEVIKRTEKTLENIAFELVVVDDNSPDGTAAIVTQLSNVYANIRLLCRSRKLGLSSAVLAGFERADPKSKIFAVMDADMQHPPELLLRMYDEILKGNDLVIASRYVNGGRIREWSLQRKVFSRMGNAMAHVLLPRTRKVNDVMSGYFMVKRNVLDKIRVKSIGYKILLEIVAKGGYRYLSEIPFLFEPRKNGKSNLKVEEVQNFIFDLTTLFQENWRVQS